MNKIQVSIDAYLREAGSFYSEIRNAVATFDCREDYVLFVRDIADDDFLCFSYQTDGTPRLTDAQWDDMQKPGYWMDHEAGVDMTGYFKPLFDAYNTAMEFCIAGADEVNVFACYCNVLSNEEVDR